MEESKKENKPQEKLREFLLSNMEIFEKKTSEYQWPWEIRRWHELAFCIMSVLTCPPLKATRVRVLIFLFADLGLLDINSLAAYISDSKVSDTQKAFQTSIFLLEREGLPSNDALRVMTAIAEAAAVLQNRFEAQIQKYLRLFGEQILQDAAKTFAFSQISDEERRLAFTLWIQNVLNMPIGADIPAVHALAQEFNVSLKDLYGIVDELGINLALLDDVVSDISILEDPEHAA